ncbi:hypothetical protein GPUN_2858 [Glaciecola punicea ACAM 611]|uniref:Polysaccharide chain length determinant N-terminal domain-containing protein n=1 Tax=Glaciecola punicea ACAM 611 TaxID=1121923 RepID=H5TF45_9ALTE|nr:hypothetical protein [Glaciecola punicea]GAB56972.1 hypothetical protein GPUN_2858 [Glaciecola punicea ACAM 611]
MNNIKKSTTASEKKAPYYASLDILDVVKILWTQKYIFLITICLSIVVSVWLALTQVELYTVELKAIPSESSLAATDNSIEANIALRLAGFGKATSEYEQHLVAVQVLRSPGFIANFIDKHNLVPLLYGVDSWNSSDGSLVWNDEIYDPVTESWIIEEPPTLQVASKMLMLNHLFIEDNRAARVLTLKFIHQSPIVAAQIVNSLVIDLNQKMKDRELNALERKLHFYETELATVQIESFRVVLSDLIEQTIYETLLINADGNFLFEVIDPPMIPEKRSYPRRGLLVIIGTILGGLLALIIAFGKSLLYPPKISQQSLRR